MQDSWASPLTHSESSNNYLKSFSIGFHYNPESNWLEYNSQQFALAQSLGITESANKLLNADQISYKRKHISVLNRQGQKRNPARVICSSPERLKLELR